MSSEQLRASLAEVSGGDRNVERALRTRITADHGETEDALRFGIKLVEGLISMQSAHVHVGNIR
jgi:hypothetical protein